MASKRPHSPELVSNPFIKKKNLAWSLDEGPEIQSPRTAPSPPARRSSKPTPAPEGAQSRPAKPGPAPSSAAIESGRAHITNHAEHFTSLLSQRTLSPFPQDAPRLAVPAYRALFESSLGSRHGAHFVIHQHDHPVAGTHYDLRLQINPTSSASWAVMYGPPGAPNGARQARNATETRVHCLWNHLVETGARETGSLLIWDTGTYAVLPQRPARHLHRRRRSSLSDREEEEEEEEADDARTEQEKLAGAFAARKIRVRLDGTCLPRPYVLYLRLTKDEDAAGRAKAARSASAPRRRRRRGGLRGASAAAAPPPETSSSSSSGSEDDQGKDGSEEDDEVVDPVQAVAQDGEEVSAMDKELRELEDAEVRRTNAYPGATNSIGSVHQRKWFLSMDREASGFVRRRRHGKVIWEAKEDRQDRHQDQSAGAADDARLTYPFFVRGVGHERSVVTGRLGAEILRDEGVTDYVGRMGWRPVLK